MFEYLKSLEKDSIEFITESAFCEYEIEKQRIENDYNMSIRLMTLTEAEEADNGEIPESKRKKFASMLVSRSKALCAAIGKSLNGVSKKLTGESGMNIDDYLSSRVGEIRMEKDIKKIQEDVRYAARKSDALVQKISKGLEIPDTEVDDFIQSTKQAIDNHGEAIFTAAAAATVYNAQVSIFDDYTKKRGMDGIYQQCKTVSGQSKIRKIMNATDNMINKESRIFDVFMTKFDKLSRKGK